MVLVYQEENEGVMTEIEARRREQRRVFQQNLLKEGLQLELEPKENSFDGKTFFLKLHIPWKIKVQYAEVMGLKLPTKKFKTIPGQTWVRLFFFFISRNATRTADAFHVSPYFELKIGYGRCQRNVKVLREVDAMGQVAVQATPVGHNEVSRGTEFLPLHRFRRSRGEVFKRARDKLMKRSDLIGVDIVEDSSLRRGTTPIRLPSDH